MEFLLAFTFLGVFFLLSGIRFVNEYDRLVVLRFGKAEGVRGPGPQLIIPLIERYQKVDTRVITMSIPIQDSMTRDNVSVKVAAVCFFQVVDPMKAVTKIENAVEATVQVSQTTLRTVVGQHDLDELLVSRDKLNAKLSAIIDRQTEAWGIKVASVEVKDVEIPDNMKRAMARQAEAERLRRAKVVAAEGEEQAAHKLAEAAAVISAQPGAMQLRQLQTMVDISVNKNNTLILPVPTDLLKTMAAPEAEGESEA